ncbi:MAG: 30S ribosomal protein S6e [Thermoplasmata archaeon]|nr:MAG: 30S ribosomal protein S6e [Thermoplasmata archaeon]
MVEFKTVISDPRSGKTYQWDVTGHHANSLVGKRIGDEVDGIFVSLPGYKLVVTGGSDKDGFPMRKEVPGPRRKKVLITESVGFHPKDKGVRKRVTVRGNTISPDIVQVNMKITSFGSKSIEDLLKEEESK